MATLGDTLAMLRRPAADGELDGEGWVANAAFGRNPGQLRMQVYRPKTLRPNAPLVVVLHGCTQDARTFARQAGWLTLADRHGFAVLAPQQVATNNPNRCFNWFNPQDVMRNTGEAASVASMIEHIIGVDRIDRSRVFITGLSAGGAMTLVMLAAYPELFAGGAVIAGLPYGVANDMGQAMALMRGGNESDIDLARLIPSTSGPRPRLSIWHGRADHVVSTANADAIAAQWALAQGLDARPDEAIAERSRTRKIWRDSSGTVAIEQHLIDGLGHGVPLRTRSASGIGETGPYMLEAGVSSSEEILQSWGIGGERLEEPPRESERDATADRPTHSRPGLVDIGDQVMTAVGGVVPTKVRDVIERALRSAGLR